jgi:hypothetical protein
MMRLKSAEQVVIAPSRAVAMAAVEAPPTAHPDCPEQVGNLMAARGRYSTFLSQRPFGAAHGEAAAIHKEPLWQRFLCAS